MSRNGGARKNDGAKGRNRTGDTALFRRVLYRLSYLGERTALGSATGQVPLLTVAKRRTSWTQP